MMSILTYIKRRIKGWFASMGTMRERQRHPELRTVTCHKCHRKIHLRPGMERADIYKHFETDEHCRKERNR